MEAQTKVLKEEMEKLMTSKQTEKAKEGTEDWMRIQEDVEKIRRDSNGTNDRLRHLLEAKDREIERLRKPLHSKVGSNGDSKGNSDDLEDETNEKLNGVITGMEHWIEWGSTRNSG